MIRLSKPQILLLHKQLLEVTGGSSGLRDEGMLPSALNAPFPSNQDSFRNMLDKVLKDNGITGKAAVM